MIKKRSFFKKFFAVSYVINIASSHLDTNVQSVKCIVHRRIRVFVKSAKLISAIRTRSLSELTLGALSLPPSFDGHSGDTWWAPGWSLPVAVPHRTISSLAIRQIVDRARTSERYVSSLDLFFVHLFLIFVLPPSISIIFFPGQMIRSSLFFSFSFSLCLSLSPIFFLLYCIDDSRIKKGTRNRSLGINCEDPTSDPRASIVIAIYCDQYWLLMNISFSSKMKKMKFVIVDKK